MRTPDQPASAFPAPSSGEQSSTIIISQFVYVCFKTDSIVSPTNSAPLYIGVMIETNPFSIFSDIVLYFSLYNHNPTKRPTNLVSLFASFTLRYITPKRMGNENPNTNETHENRYWFTSGKAWAIGPRTSICGK